jgi:hypothetical protein
VEKKGVKLRNSEGCEICEIGLFPFSFVIATKETKNLGKTMLPRSPEYFKNHCQSFV